MTRSTTAGSISGQSEGIFDTASQSTERAAAM